MTKRTRPSNRWSRSASDHAVRELAANDVDLAGTAERHGHPPLWVREPGFETLVRIILVFYGLTNYLAVTRLLA
jgi:tRNA pseudouridine-54 N-methylase